MGRSQTLTAAFAYDGERAVLTNHRSTAEPQRPERNNTGTTVQYQAQASRASVIAGIRFENNGSFGFYVAPRLAVSLLASSGNGGVGATLRLSRSNSAQSLPPQVPDCGCVGYFSSTLTRSVRFVVGIAVPKRRLIAVASREFR